MADRLAPQERHVYAHEGQAVYEWDQTLEEVNLYVPVPPGTKAAHMFCNIATLQLAFGLKGNPPFLDKKLFKACIAEDSFWTLEDGELHVTLAKREKGSTWRAALEGHEINMLSADEDQKRLMLERFQEENPGFDFSGAEFNGACPDPRTFMNGISYR